MSSGPALGAFAGYGIELEYMIVDTQSLCVQAIADRLLCRDGAANGEITRGALGWSNELVRHVIEVKNLQPVPALATLPRAFQAEIAEIERRLAPFGARLMPGAMHPWMDPQQETQLWQSRPSSDDRDAIYRVYERIFDCRSHGWANLQSMHINLPFADDAQFARLHAAVRMVIPILPALAASSPIAEGRASGLADTRMQAYCGNAKNFPSITGSVVPETVTSRADYEARILAPMYRAIAPYDPEQVLQHEWLNSRGAIARFDRNALEIRVLDTQECPQADLAVAAATVAVVRALYEADNLAEQQESSTQALAAILHACIHEAERAVIGNSQYLRLLGYDAPCCTAGALWRHLIEKMSDREPDVTHWQPALRVLVEQGPLARRLLRALGDDFTRANLEAVYGELCDCLRAGRMFTNGAREL